MKVTVENLSELKAQTAKWFKKLKPPSDGATVLALSGELGAGKTAFTQVVAALLGVEATVSSPTFVLMKTYPILPGGRGSSRPWRRLVHLDCYRLNSSAELEKLGWRELLADPQNIIFLEWPERVGGALPPTALQIGFEILSPAARQISFP